MRKLTDVSGTSPLPWAHRRANVMATRLKSIDRLMLFNAFSRVSCTEYTADFLYELPITKAVALMEHFIAFPDDATRMDYLHPDDQRAELDRLTGIISDAPAKDD